MKASAYAHNKHADVAGCSLQIIRLFTPICNIVQYVQRQRYTCMTRARVGSYSDCQQVSSGCYITRFTCWETFFLWKIIFICFCFISTIISSVKHQHLCQRLSNTVSLFLIRRSHIYNIQSYCSSCLHITCSYTPGICNQSLFTDYFISIIKKKKS